MTKDIVEKIERGEALTAEELDAAWGFYTQLSRMLELLGPKFWLVTSEVWRVVDSLERIRTARGLR